MADPVHISVNMEVQMPAEELDTFLDLIRTWDGGRESVRVAMKVYAAGTTVEELKTMFDRLEPPLPVRRKEDA